LRLNSKRIKRNMEDGQCCSCGRGPIGDIGGPGKQGEDGKKMFYF
jgi:hypothetical protein